VLLIHKSYHTNEKIRLCHGNEITAGHNVLSLYCRYKQCLFSTRKVGILKEILVGAALGGIWFCQFAIVGLVNWYGTSLLVSGNDMAPADVIFVSRTLVPIN